MQIKAGGTVSENAYFDMLSNPIKRVGQNTSSNPDHLLHSIPRAIEGVVADARTAGTAESVFSASERSDYLDERRG